MCLVSAPAVGGFRSALRYAVADVLITTAMFADGHLRLWRRPDQAADSQGPPNDTRGQQASPPCVDLAREGDAEAFGASYDHYSPAVYRFIYYRVSTQAIAEDLTSETFFRALRSMASFQWQGKDFGAWLMTIARNLVVDHYKAGRTRLETSTDDFSGHERVDRGPEDEVIATLTNEILRGRCRSCPAEQQECLVLRFLNGSSIAETAKALGRTEGAIKQLQLRAVRNLAKLMPEGVR